MKNLKNWLLAFARVSLGIIINTQAYATSVRVHDFVPTANPTYLYSEDALLDYSWANEQHREVYFGAFYDFVNDPLVELNAAGNQRVSTIVDSINSIDLSLGYLVRPDMQIGFSGAMSVVRLPDQSQQFGFGDTRLFAKVRLNSDHDAVVFAIMPELWVPTGNRTLFLSNDSFSGGMRLIAEHDFRVAQVSGNVGYRYSPNAVYRDLNLTQVVPVSLGILVPLSKQWALNGDATGEIPFPYNSKQTPSAFYMGARCRLSNDFIVTAGGAVGSVNNYSSSDYRILAGISLLPSAQAAVVQQEPAVQKTPPKVVFTPKAIELYEEVKFAHNKAVLTPAGASLLEEVVKVLHENQDSYQSIVIEGHTNELGTDIYNMKLSEERAAAVKEYLVSRGILETKLQTVGYGKTRPKALAYLSEQTRLELNRRVEFKVVK